MIRKTHLQDIAGGVVKSGEKLILFFSEHLLSGKLFEVHVGEMGRVSAI